MLKGTCYWLVVGLRASEVLAQVAEKAALRPS